MIEAEVSGRLLLLFFTMENNASGVRINNPSSSASSTITRFGDIDNSTSSTSPTMPHPGCMDIDKPGSSMSSTKTQIDDIGIDCPGSCMRHTMTQFDGMKPLILRKKSMESVVCSDSIPRLGSMEPLNLSMRSWASLACMDSIPGTCGVNAVEVCERNREGVGKFSATLQQAHADKNTCSSPLHARPHNSYCCLITNAIQNSPSKQLTTAEIYQFIIDRFPNYQGNQNGWQRSLRTILYTNDCFVKVPHETEGCYAWKVHPDAENMFENNNSGSSSIRKKMFKCEKEEAFRQVNKDLKSRRSTSPSSEEDSQQQSLHLDTSNTNHIPQYAYVGQH